MIDRELLEEEIRELSRKCKCFSRDGACGACMKAEKLNDKLDIMQAEDDLLREIVAWMNSPEMKAQYNNAQSVLRGIAACIERQDFRKKDLKNSPG
jgi:hypothetical protein